MSEFPVLFNSIAIIVIGLAVILHVVGGQHKR